ncbi:MAG: hypothetical protein KGH89_00490 [Thaumarchaeota archaeon]|nr:hypothetical protein [Nitrososphaerota archaeon]
MKIYSILQKRTKKTISFRVDPHVIDGLNKAAKDDRITLNALVDQIFDNYVTWDRKATKSGWILVKNNVLKLFIENIDEKKIARLGIRAAGIVMRDTLLSISGKIDLESWLLVTKHRSMRSDFAYQESKSNDDGIKLVITHGMGLKWSLFHKWYYLQMLKDLGKKADAEYTANTLVINIKNVT